MKHSRKSINDKTHFSISSSDKKRKKLTNKVTGHSVKAIIFDWGGVLIHMAPLYDHIRRIGKFLGADEQKYLDAHTNDILYELWKGKITEDQCLRKICSKLGIRVKGRPRVEGTTRCYRKIEGMYRLLLRLRKNGYKIALLSNASARVVQYFGSRHNHYFDKALYSCDLGLVKPDRRIFLHALKELNVTPRESVFIDDLQVNVEASRKLGIHGIVFKSKDQLLIELKRYGVKI